ncbi:MAG TPA: hypothetical protein VG077_17525 [Verrucomicrobiae bacterium]|nr:hypothetical protein [Verrucomicrobiae bacterium]
MRIPTIFCIAVYILFAVLISAHAQQKTNVPTSNQGPQSNLLASVQSNQSAFLQPSQREEPKAFSSDPGTFRSWFFDGAAAIFGILAVFFAIVTVVATVVGVITGISKFRDLIKRVESDLKDKIVLEFGKRLNEVVEREIEPQVKEIIEKQLKTTLETGKQRIEEEISRSIKDSDLKEILINEVAAEIRARLSAPPQSPKVEPKEFGQ